MTTTCLMRSSGAGGPLRPWSANAGVAPRASSARQRTGTCRNGRFMNSLPKARRAAGLRLVRSMSLELGARIHAPLAAGQTDERQMRRAGLDRDDDAGAAAGDAPLRAGGVGHDDAPERLDALAVERAVEDDRHAGARRLG